MLQEQIKYQVQLNECVIIPDFGSIVSNYVPARIIDTANSRMLPPSKKMVFNERLQHDDGVFVQNVALQLKISFSEAKEMVANFVADAKETIFSGEVLLIDGVGAFTTLDGISIVFEPALLENVLVDSFGLSAFQTPVINETITRKTFEKQMQKNSTTRRFMKSKQFVGIALIAPVVIMVALLLPVDSNFLKKEKASMAVFDRVVDTDNVKPEYANPVEDDLMQSVDKRNALMYVENTKEVVSEPLQEEVIETVEEKAVELAVEEPVVEEAVEVAETPVEAETIEVVETVAETVEETVVMQESDRFHIIVGVFTGKKNADKLMNQLKDSGFDSQVFESGGRFRVSLDSYQTKESAVNELEELAVIDAEFFSGAWVLEK